MIKISKNIKKTLTLSSENGTTLLELIVVILVISIMSSIILGSFVSSINVSKVEKTQKEMDSIALSSESYQWQHSSPPSGVSDLTSGGQIQQGFTGTNPFGNQYTISSNPAGTITVQTNIPFGVSKTGMPFGTGGTTLSVSIPKRVDDVMSMKIRKELFE